MSAIQLTSRADFQKFQTNLPIFIIEQKLEFFSDASLKICCLVTLVAKLSPLLGNLVTNLEEQHHVRFW